MNRLLLILIACVLVACKTVPVQLEGSPVESGKRVGVISMLDERFVMKSAGLRHGHSEKDYRITAWNMNVYAAGIVMGELKSQGAFVSIDIHSGTEALLQAYRSSPAYPAIGPDNDELTAMIRRIGKEQGADLLLLVMPMVDRDIIFSSTQKIRGMGLYRHTTPFGIRTKLYFIGKLILLDTATAKPLSERLLFFEETVDNAFWKTEYEKIDAVQQHYLEKRIKGQLAIRVQEQMRRAGLLKEIAPGSTPVSGRDSGHAPDR
jgi:hypothetical protein